MKQKVYLDNAATTKLDQEIILCINKINLETFGNPSSLHTLGINSEKIIKGARKTLADSIGALEKEIYFTSGGTESNNMAIFGYVTRNFRNGKHIVTTQIEHPSVLEVYKQLGKSGYEIDIVKVDKSGYVDLEDLKTKINKETILFSFILVNNEIGTIQKANEIIKIVKSINYTTKIHIDAVQAYGKIKISIKDNAIDMLSISGHKINGPKGIGALYVKDKINLNPIIYGGGQEFGVRSGTENISGIGALGLAAKLAYEKLEFNYDKVKELKNYFVKKSTEKLSDFIIISPNEALPHILSLGFADIKSEVLLHHLETVGIYVSTGSACTARKKNRSHVISALDIDKKYLDGIIRVSFEKDLSFTDLDYTINNLSVILPKIRIRRGVRR